MRIATAILFAIAFGLGLILFGIPTGPMATVVNLAFPMLIAAVFAAIAGALSGGDREHA